MKDVDVQVANRQTLQPVADAQIAQGFARALAEASKWRGSTSPNPPVGCVALNADGNTLAVAAHQRAGEPHAEALVIAQARELGVTNAIDTLIVTLEPCNHTGRTGPCTEAILTTGCRTVWIAARDANPHVAGSGAKRLEAAGITVRFLRELQHPDAAQLQRDADLLIAPFTKRVTEGVPWVTVKQAVDINGSMIPARGQKTFTSPSSLIFAHELRRRADAILTGSGTIIADDPEFTVRHVADFSAKRRLLLIADRRRRVNGTYIDAANGRGFDVACISDIHAALKDAADRGCNEVLVEAGPTITRAILATDLWDEHVLIEKQAHEPDMISFRYRRLKGYNSVFRHH